MNGNTDRAIDPATVEVLRNRIANIAEEMQATTMNAAYSPLWSEAGDLSAAVLDENAEIVGQGERIIPNHIAAMKNSIDAAIEATGGYGELEPGDILINNDTYAGDNLHLNDFLVAEPVFSDGVLLGFSAVIGHWTDVGGSTPGSYSMDAKDIVAEGVRVPPAKLYRRGERNDDLFRFIIANTRDRNERLGDFNAQLSGVKKGVSRLEVAATKYGTDTIGTAMELLLSQDEKQMREKISLLPDGTYRAEDHLDSDELQDDPLSIVVAVRIDGSDVTIDFEGTDPQISRGYNAPPSGTEAASNYAVSVTIDPTTPATLGKYRPVTVRAPEGTIVNPSEPAPVSAGNHETVARIFDVVVKAIAEIDPSLAFGAGEGSSNILISQPLAQEDETIMFTEVTGGSGGCPNRDGINAIRSTLGNTGLQSNERLEADYEYITVEDFSIVPGTGGAGRHRGGNTMRRIMRFDEDAQLSIITERIETKPYGIAGGESGRSAKNVYIDERGERRSLPSKTNLEIDAGAKILMRSAGGGGYGPPSERPQNAVLSDLKNGYISPKQARETYQVDEWDGGDESDA